MTDSKTEKLLGYPIPGLNDSDFMDKVMPFQPIVKGHFVPNRIILQLRDFAHFSLYDLFKMGFTDQELMQYVQLLGYSLSDFQDLDFVDEQTLEAVKITSAEATQENEIEY